MIRRIRFFFADRLLIATILIVAIFMMFPSITKLRELYEIGMVEDNLVAIADAGKAHLAEKGGDLMAYADMVSSGLIAEAEPVLGESYGALTVKSRGGVLTVKTSMGREISVKY